VPNLAQRPEPCYRSVIEKIITQVSAMTNALAAASSSPPRRFRFGAQAWAMILRRDDYVMLHDHADAHWSTAYYVDAGDEVEADRSGALALVDPRRSGRSLPGVDLFGTTFEVRPRSGALVIFPGWLQPYVHPYRGERPRISISCNLIVEAIPA